MHSSSSLPRVRTLTTLLEGGSFFEGPRWQDGRWWVSDFYRGLVQAVDPDGRAEEVMQVPEAPSGLGWLPDGSLLVVSMANRRVLRRSPDGEVTVHADLADRVEFALNDMVVDAQGRAYVGNFGFDLMNGGFPATTSLFRVDPDGSVTEVADGMMFPNGSVITPDGGTLIVGETGAGRYSAFTIAEDGSLSDRRVVGAGGRAGADRPAGRDARAAGVRAGWLLPGRRGLHLGRGRQVGALHPARRGRRDPRGDPSRDRRLRLHARRRGRAHAAHVHRARVPGARARGQDRRATRHHAGGRAARRAS
jgi:hypothetical protein